MAEPLEPNWVKPFCKFPFSESLAVKQFSLTRHSQQNIEAFLETRNSLATIVRLNSNFA
jgi:hypothetical protein